MSSATGGASANDGATANEGGAATPLRRGRFGLLVVGAIVLVVAVIAVIAPSGFDEGRYLDPASSEPGGTKALVLLLEGLGAQVEVVHELPLDDHDVALVLEDRLGDAELDSMDAWVSGGGTLVVADTFSPLNPYTASVNANPEEPADRNCAIAALAEVRSMSGTLEVLHADEGSVACFGDGAEGQVVIGPVGRGMVVALGGPEPFTNENIDEQDDAVLIAALLAPRPGTKVALVGAAQVGEGGETIRDLLGDRVHQGLFQLAFGFLVYVLWRARRLGAPVSEPLPVEPAASELVRSMGRLLHQGETRDQVGRLLNDDMRRRLSRRLNLDPGLTDREVAVVAAARTGLAIERFEAVLVPSSLDTDRDLVALGVALEQIDREVRHV